MLTRDGTDRLGPGHQVLEPFQELPQLLDPHLASWVSTLATAYLEFNVMRAVDRRQQQLLEAERGGGDRAAPEKDKAVSNKWSVPLSTAITDILYTLCKIRGEKVIVRFLHAEVRYIEPLIAAFEAAEPRPQQGPVERWRPTPMGTMWKYEERYIVLLWLSHLMLAPFDLATISSDRVSVSDEDVEDESDEDNKGATSSNRDRQHDAAIPGFEWPAGLPSIATRLLPLATKYLVVPSKERDGARALLVRLAMRRDMQALGLLDALVRWGLGIVRPPRTLAAGEASGVVHSIYAYVGVLSLLAGMLRSSETTLDMVPYLRPIFSAVTGVVVDAAAVDNRQQAKGRDAVSELIVGSATARKLLVKTARCCAVAALHYVRNQGVLSSMGAEGERKRAALSADQAIDIVEEAVGYLMERLPDTDTPVRFAASKALSVITLALGAGSTGDGADGFNSETMAHDVVEAVLQALKENVRVTTGPPVVADEDGDRLDIVVPYIGDYSQSMSEEGEAKATAARPRVYDLSSVSPLAWHGLVLTLSHLLYRRSPPRSMLKDVVEALRLALQFEQRSATGGSVGANVRDAACFGAWAVARRYTTEELLAAEGEDFNGGSGRGSGKTAVSVTREEDEPSAAGEGGTGGGGSKGSERSHEKEEEWETEEEMSEKQSKAKRKKAGKKPQSLKLDASATAPVRPKLGPRTSSLLQSLATSLVVTATLDPSGNVRRAASAALQELVGRHPDSIVAGIALVQAVDYHAVALRSRACLEVAARAAAAPYTPTGCLDEYAHRVEMRSVFVDSGSAADATVCLLDYPARAYAVPILEAVLDSWRGVGGSAGESTEAAAAAARRMLARAYGKISEAVFLAEMARVVPILDPFHDTKYRRRPDWVPDSPDEEKKVAADREDEDSLPPLVPIVAGPGDDSSQDGGVGPSRTRALAPWKLDRVPKHGTVLIEKRLSKLSLAIVTRLLDSYKGDAVTKDGKGRPGERNARGGSEKRRIERRHGLILCGAALLDAVPSIIHRLHAESMLPPVLWSALCRIFWQKGEGDGDQSDNMLRIVFRGDVYASLPPLPSDDGGDGGDGQPTQSPPPSTTQPPRMPKLLVEAFCRLLVAHLPILMMEGVLDEETEAAEMASGSAGRPPKPAFAALPLVTPPFDLVAPGSDLVSPPRIHAVANAAIAGRIPFARKGQGGVLSDLLVRAIMSQAMTANLASTWTTGTTSGDGVDDFGDDGDNQLADAASAAAVTIAALLDRRRFAYFVFELCCGAFQEPVRLRYPDGVASPWGHATDLHWLRGDRVGGGGGGGSGASGSGAGAGAGGGVGSLPITPLLRALTRIFPLTTSTMFVDLSTTVGAALLHWWSLTTPKVIAGLALPAPPLGFLQKGRATAAPVAAGTSNAQESDATVLSSLPSGPTDIEARVALLRALTTKTDILTLTPQRWTDMLADALDDYTTNARGDVGSYVRVEAVRCVRVIWEALLRQDALGRAAREDYGDGADASGEGGAEEGDRIGISIAELALKPDVAILLRKIWRLAAEKLDRVRNDARETLFVLMRHAKYVT